MRRWLLRALGAVALVFATVLLVRAYDASRLPDLKPWHRRAPRSEPTAGELDAGMDLAGYLRREAAVFREVREIEAATGEDDRNPGNRYYTGSALNPGRFATDWNRTFELVPERVRGGALLIHGLTDSPYSMRHLAEIFRRQGFYVLCLRMQGHGTVPAGLTAASWQDWLAAVRMGARHVRARAGGGKPFVLVGYSNGGGLAVKYALDALDSAALPRPGRLILLSPMIGVTPFARFSALHGFLGVIPGFEKAGWVDVLPEYNPFKYTSFPAHGGRQIYELTSALQEQVRRASETGRIAGLAPILTFQSLADDTVSTRAVAEKLYDRLPANGSELVLFDVNRQAYLRPFLLPGLDAELAARLKGPPRSYGLSLVTNAGTATSEVVARSFAAVTGAASTRPLGLSWPPQMYSLSHVAIPFPVTDPLYGLAPDPREFFGARLGTLTPRGERSLLSVPTQQLMRATCNPFFPYLESRVREWLGGG